jgi:hypothetical protein
LTGSFEDRLLEAVGRDRIERQTLSWLESGARWDQIKTILWLRWRLTRNQVSRAGWLSVIVTAVVSTLGIVIGIAGAVVGLLVGLFVLSDVGPEVLLVVCNVFALLLLLFWLTGVPAGLQRAGAIALGRLLHSPVSLRTVFVSNYIASRLTLSILGFGPATKGVAVGLAIARSWVMVALLPLLVGFVLTITAWTW